MPGAPAAVEDPSKSGQPPLSVALPCPPEVQDVQFLKRDFPGGAGTFEVKYNSALSKSLLSGVLEFASSTGGVTCYEGSFLNDAYSECPKLHGDGVRHGPDGSAYSGQWANGVQEGHGEWRQGPPSYESYVGDWRKGQRHGFGIHKFANGDRYEGDWKEGKFHDRGKFYYANGDKFLGIWKEGMKVNGSLYFQDGRVSRRTYDQGRLMTCQDFDPRKNHYLPTITRNDVHDHGRDTSFPAASGGAPRASDQAAELAA